MAPWTTDEGIFPLDDQEDAPEKYRPSLWMPTPDRTPRSPVTSTTHSVEGGCLKSPVTVEPPTPMVQKEGKNVHSGASSKAERGSGVAKIEAVSKKSPVRLLCAEGKEPGSEEMELGSVATVQEVSGYFFLYGILEFVKEGSLCDHFWITNSTVSRIFGTNQFYALHSLPFAVKVPLSRKRTQIWAWKKLGNVAYPSNPLFVV